MDSSFTDLNTSDIEPMEPNRPTSATSSRSCLSSLSNHSGPEYLARTIAEMHPNRPPVTVEERLAAHTRRLNIDVEGAAPDPSWVPYVQTGEDMSLQKYRISPRDDVSWEVLERFTERLRFETEPGALEVWELPGMQTVYYWDVELTTAQVGLYREDPAVESIHELTSEHDDLDADIEDDEEDWEDEGDEDQILPGKKNKAPSDSSNAQSKALTGQSEADNTSTTDSPDTNCNTPTENYIITPNPDVDSRIINAFTARLEIETDPKTLVVNGDVADQKVDFWSQDLTPA